MNDRLVIGFAGLKQHGKDTAANAARAIINTRFGAGSAARIAFADSLKDDIRRLGFNEDSIRDKPKYMRRLLQEYGVARREEDPLHWIKLLQFKVDELPKHVRLVTVPDVRFQNEANWIKNMGGFVVKMVREGFYNPVDLHPSETGLPDFQFDAVIQVKDGDIDGIVDKVREFLKLHDVMRLSNGRLL